MEETNLRKFDEFRRLAYENEEEIFWDDTLNFGYNFKAIADRCFLLPYHDIQMPIFISYALLPSALSTIVPILFLNGGKGSGKSTAMQLIAAIHGQEVLSALSTGAAIRNHINRSRWYDWITCDGEKNTCLLFDNVSKQTFKDEFLYLLFLNGYNRKTDQIIMSKGDGENYTFRVFAPKVISSIHPLLGDPELDELSRRLMVLKFKNFDAMDVDERGSKILNSFDMLNIESLNLSIIRAKYNEFWTNEQMLNYALNKKAVKKYVKSNQSKINLSSARWTIAPDLLATGLTFEVWYTAEQALKALQNYWEWHDKNIGNRISPLQAILIELIKKETTRIEEINNNYGDDVLDKEISPQLVLERVKQANQAGELDITATQITITIAMNALGWQLEKNSFKKMVWREIK